MDELIGTGRPVVLAAGLACALAAALLVVPRPRRRATQDGVDEGGRPRPASATSTAGLLGRVGQCLCRLPRRWTGQGTRPRLAGEALRRDVAEMLRQLAALLQSGRSPGQAWGDLRDHWRRRADAHPVARVCAEVARAESAGDGAAVGLRRADGQLGRAAGAHGLSPVDSRALREVLGRLRGAVALSEETGAPLAELVRRLAAATEEEAELHAAIRTAVAGPQTTQLILVLLPLAGVGLGQVMGAEALSRLLDGGFGTVCLVLGLTLLAAGWWWGRGMIRAAVPHG